jgi:Kef-type K+ transport system membrane component KefB
VLHVGTARKILIGAAVVAVPVELVVAWAAFGDRKGAPTAAASPAGAAAADPFARLLVALPVVLAACYLAGVLAKRLGQPPVIGEIVAGVLLGPSLFGLVWPAGFAWLFPAGVVGAINTLAQLGLIFFMFLVGAEINLGVVRRRGAAAVTVSQLGIAVPMLVGVVLALGLYPSFGGAAGFLPFALFIAVSMSITAFPVLARILTDRGISGTPLGALALTCAAIGDVAAWCLLVMVTAIAHGGPAAEVVLTLALTLAFVALMMFVVRPGLAVLVGRLSEAAVLPIMLAGIMLAALATNQIGVHPIFGAFLFGAAAPRTGGALVPKAKQAADKMHSVTVTLLLPLFFVYTGLHTRFGLLGSHGTLWAWCALVTVVAGATKAGSSTLAARLSGIGWRESLSLGALMNCRGLTELVVLNVGLQLKVISPTVFAMLVVMTLVSTIATAPALALIGRVRRDGVAAAAVVASRSGVVAADQL